MTGLKLYRRTVAPKVLFQQPPNPTRDTAAVNNDKFIPVAVTPSMSYRNYTAKGLSAT